MIISNIPQEIKWKAYRGDTASFTIYINDDQDDPIDVTDWTWTALAVEEDGTEVSLDVTPADGQVTVQIVWPLNDSVFDVQAVRPEGTWTVIKGHILVEDDVTP